MNIENNIMELVRGHTEDDPCSYEELCDELKHLDYSDKYISKALEDLVARGKIKMLEAPKGGGYWPA